MCVCSGMLRTSCKCGTRLEQHRASDFSAALLCTVAAAASISNKPGKFLNKQAARFSRALLRLDRRQPPITLDWPPFSIDVDFFSVDWPHECARSPSTPATNLVRLTLIFDRCGFFFSRLTAWLRAIPLQNERKTNVPFGLAYGSWIERRHLSAVCTCWHIDGSRLIMVVLNSKFHNSGSSLACDPFGTLAPFPCLRPPASEAAGLTNIVLPAAAVKKPHWHRLSGRMARCWLLCAFACIPS